MPKIPNSYIKSEDGSIKRVIEIYQKDSDSTVVKMMDGFTKISEREVKSFCIETKPKFYLELTIN